jgi:hypothetical protein
MFEDIPLRDAVVKYAGKDIIADCVHLIEILRFPDIVSQAAGLE